MLQMEKPAEKKNCLSEAYILPFISNICLRVDEREKEWTKSETYLQLTTFL